MVLNWPKLGLPTPCWYSSHLHLSAVSSDRNNSWTSQIFFLKMEGESAGDVPYYSAWRSNIVPILIRNCLRLRSLSMCCPSFVKTYLTIELKQYSWSFLNQSARTQRRNYFAYFVSTGSSTHRTGSWTSRHSVNIYQILWFWCIYVRHLLVLFQQVEEYPHEITGDFFLVVWVKKILIFFR